MEGLLRVLRRVLGLSTVPGRLGGSVSGPNPTTSPTGTQRPGQAVNQMAQGSYLALMQGAATADGNGAVAVVDGFNGLQEIEVQKTGTGTTSIVPEGSFDQLVWYAIGYYQVDGVATPARAAGAFALGAGTQDHLLQLGPEVYPYVRARITGTSGAVAVSANIYALPA